MRWFGMKWVAGTMALALVLAGCGGSGTGSGTGANNGSPGNTTRNDKPKSYKFGALLPLTGNAAVSGEFERQAIDLAVKEVNAKGGIDGVPLEPVYEDMAADPKMVVPALQKLISVDKVPFSLIGYSSVTLAAAPIAQDAKVLLLNSGASSARLANAGPYVFNSIVLADMQARVILWHTAKVQKLTKVAVYYRNDDLGTDIVGIAKEYGAKIGVTIVGTESFAPAAQDHKAQLAKIKALNPEAIFVVATGNETGNILKQAKELGIKTQWISYAGFENSNTLTIGGEAAEGGLYTISSAIAANGQEYPEAQNFYDTFAKTYNKDRNQIDYLAPQFYEGALLFADALRVVVKEGKPYTGDSLRDAFKKLTGFKSVFGETKFADNGAVIKPVSVKTVKNGKFGVVKVYSVEDIQKMGN